MSELTIETRIDIDDPEEPTVYICVNGVAVLEVFEKPICMGCEESYDPDDWEPGMLANLILHLLKDDYLDAHRRLRQFLDIEPDLVERLHHEARKHKGAN